MVDSLSSTNKIAVLTGAGISAESGIPTFREAQSGLWEKYNPSELATPEAFLANPRLVWDWYLWRRQLISDASPNRGHIALSSLEKYLNKNSKNFSLITQNVDGLHRDAGSKDIIELHGNIRHAICFKCHRAPRIPIKLKQVDEIPRCPDCGGLYRPDVVWFGEQLVHRALASAIQAAEESDIFFSIGTSNVLQPAASLPLLAKQKKP